ncbi:MAG TPA: MATE family efflux transporter [Hyphomicrobiales bacterium]|nr:MATE family efflux transporter [Hyphomicrobiales bacterium]
MTIATPAAAVLAEAEPVAPPLALDPRTERLLRGPIAATLLALAWPNILIMVAQASSGLVETWFVAKLGTDALAGVALAFPLVMLMQMISAGAIGGGISAAVGRALGAGQRERADALVVHALAISLGAGAAFSVAMLLFGREVYGAMGARDGALQAALTYSNVVFAGNILLWAMNGLASVVRGTGNMLVPALVSTVGVALLVPLSPLLIFGVGPFPALGIAGGAAAVIAFYAGGTAFLAWYIASGRNLARLRSTRLRWDGFRDILKVGALSTVSSVQTNLIVAVTTALAAGVAGPDAVAGYGTGARLEYLLIPLVFGLGAPMVAMVGTNIGAGQRERALRIGFTGGAIAFAITEAIGLAAALFPRAWIALFSTVPGVIGAGTAYLHAVGPFYGFFGLGLGLYFASQGAGRLAWPLGASFVRMVVAIVGGWLAVRTTGSLGWLFAATAAGLLLYGMLVPASILVGGWRKPS